MKIELLIRGVQEGDVEQLQGVLEQGVVDKETGEPIRDEISDILGLVADSARGEGSRRYMVATIGDKVVGLIGVKEPDEVMSAQARTPAAKEVVNLFVGSESRGSDAGRALVEAAARVSHAPELVVNSGPRYEASWGFYDKVFGNRIGLLRDYYGEGRDAPVWSLILEDNNPDESGN